MPTRACTVNTRSYFKKFMTSNCIWNMVINPIWAANLQLYSVKVKWETWNCFVLECTHQPFGISLQRENSHKQTWMNMLARKKTCIAWVGKCQVSVVAWIHKFDSCTCWVLFSKVPHLKLNQDSRNQPPTIYPYSCYGGSPTHSLYRAGQDLPCGFLRPSCIETSLPSLHRTPRSQTPGWRARSK